MPTASETITGTLSLGNPRLLGAQIDPAHRVVMANEAVEGRGDHIAVLLRTVSER
jgi:hypothetical protein